MNRIVRLSIAGIQLFPLQAVQLNERLSCSADAKSGLICRRAIQRILHSNEDTFLIQDGRSVTLQVSGHTTSSHVYVNASSIVAADSRGRTVVLLSVPEREVAGASAIVQHLRELGRATPPRFVYARNDGRTLWLFVAVTAAWWLFFFGLSHFRRVRTSVS